MRPGRSKPGAVGTPAPAPISAFSRERVESRTASGDRGEKPEPLEAVADLGRLGLVGLDERQAQPADLVAEELERPLDRDRIRLHSENLDGRPKLLVERVGALDVAGAVARDELLHLRSHDMGVDADATNTADLEERQEQVVVAGVEVEPGRDDVPRRLDRGLRLLHRADVLDLGEPRDRLRLRVDDDA